MEQLKKLFILGFVVPVSTWLLVFGIIPTLSQEYLGVVEGISLNDFLDWNQCWREHYNVDGQTSIDQLFGELCTRERLLIGCRRVGEDSLLIGAEGRRSDIIKNTGKSNQVSIANNVGWYFSGDWSIGFAAAGDSVNRISCDYDFYNKQSNPHLRFCMQTKAGFISNGFRCGNHTFLGNSEGWERVIFHADVPTGAPSMTPTTASPSSTPSAAPVTSKPTISPTAEPTTMTPSASPSGAPRSPGPTTSPTDKPTASPTEPPTDAPSTSPSETPSAAPTAQPTDSPTDSPTETPSNAPSRQPTVSPSGSPSFTPTTSLPTTTPTRSPTFRPSKAPRTSKPSRAPTPPTTWAPSTSPTPRPSAAPTRTDQFFPGVRTHIELSRYYKWEPCWEEIYEASGLSHVDDILLRNCTKKRLMVACRSPQATNILVVAAQAPREDVTFNTKFVEKIGKGRPDPITPHVANGVAWYWNTNHSFGFAPEGRDIVLDDCDLADEPERLCVHFTNDTVTFGYRCGVSTRNNIGNWTRLILHTDEDKNDFE